MTRQPSNRAFTLVELIIAIFILGIGMISIASLFPAGIKQQEIAEDDVYGPLVARHAMELLRTRLKQEDFGCFEDFSTDTLTVRDPIPLGNVSATGVVSTIAKDWIWKRPGFVTVDDASSTGCDEAGMYDIFSYYSTRKNVGGNRSGTTKPLIPSEFTPTTLLSDVAITTTGRNRLYGIPYNRRIYDELFDVTQPNYAWTYAQNGIPASGSIPNGNNLSANALREPAVFITQRERYWPMPANAVGVTPTPRYVWDCMFRRFNGRILVGMFVYRVIPANGLMGGNPNTMTPYISAAVTTALDPIISIYPPIPQWVSSRDNSPKNLKLDQGFSKVDQGTIWGAGGLNAKVGGTQWSAYFSPNRDDCGVPGTGPSNTNNNPADATSFDPTALTYSETWQQPGQWMIDQYNNVHHVIEGRRTHDDGPVILAKPVPRQPYSNALFDSANRDLSSGESLLATPGSGGDAGLGIQDLWFVPPYDANGNQILPVYACVEEL